MVRLYSLIGVAAVVSMTACGKKEPSPPVNAAPQPLPSVSVPQTATPQAATPIAPTSPNAIPSVPVAAAAAAESSGPKVAAEDYLEPLNEAYNSFEKELEYYPSSLEEMISKGFIRRLPPTPAGMKFQVDSANRRIVLVKTN